MKFKLKTSFLFFCFINLFFLNEFRAQTEVYKSIQLKTLLNQYTVTAVFDTTFAREVVITMNDTIGFQNLTAVLSIQTETGWNTLQTILFNKPLTKTICLMPLCIYRRNELEWVIYLGAFSLLDRHKIELQFNSSYSNTPSIWEDEF